MLMPGTFIDVTVDAAVAGDAELARKLAEVCPVDIFAAGVDGLRIVDREPRRVRPLRAVHQRRAGRLGDRAQALLGRDAARLTRCAHRCGQRPFAASRLRAAAVNGR